MNKRLKLCLYLILGSIIGGIGLFVLFVAGGYLLVSVCFPWSGPTSKDCPSEAEAKAHFFKHETQFEELKDIYQTYGAETIEANSTLSRQVDSLSTIVACKTYGGSTFYYFQGGTILAGTDMYFSYRPDISERQSRGELSREVLPDDMDLLEATPNEDPKCKHLKGDWYIGLSRY